MNNTLDYYNKNADEFILGTVNADMTATLDIIGKENCLARAKKSIK